MSCSSASGRGVWGCSASVRSSGEGQQRRDPGVPAVRATWRQVRAQLHALREVRGEWRPGAPAPRRLPAPSDVTVALPTDPRFITWSPVCRQDVAWNIERSLVGRDRAPVRRSSRRFPTVDSEPDLETLLSQGPRGASGTPAGPAAGRTQRCPLGVSSTTTAFPLNLRGGTPDVPGKVPRGGLWACPSQPPPPTPPPCTTKCPVSGKINK